MRKELKMPRSAGAEKRLKTVAGSFALVGTILVRVWWWIVIKLSDGGG